ncbi:hypothetical protein J3Q64DRAFT_1703301 [Phycomyces blakesleeanus]|uniref:Uncharacterized protein n=2 Tax=Phycomyces blakesleeanus TaxID=4837 RepID=A0A162TU00_PHYB8|nr:hypothetical protein PHYBLDRAFT_70538 [Phycomyces blakesleeanus NRRL 1555(-)]OAD69813.1 hypothetical protein PHYBLDRAFT_70538 [Phycomyces blakesleeanus NRRL 1555(-)]|eukprot:XP_018287853.1 hypothetical protein PHYBLDRAFT_70538 [Phycomyces blakesleeanus NRRL 1555(-)]
MNLSSLLFFSFLLLGVSTRSLIYIKKFIYTLEKSPSVVQRPCPHCPYTEHPKIGYKRIVAQEQNFRYVAVTVTVAFQTQSPIKHLHRQAEVENSVAKKKNETKTNVQMLVNILKTDFRSRTKLNIFIIAIIYKQEGI